MRLRLAAVLAGGTALSLAPAVVAQVQDRFRVAAGYSRTLVVVLKSPPEYTRESIGRFGNDGHWKGPRYQATKRASLGGESKLDWAAPVEREPATRATIIKHLVQDWKVIEEG